MSADPKHMNQLPPAEIVAISNGFHKMHLTTAAREASDRGLLRLAITGAYPTGTVRRLARLLRVARSGRVGRLMQRDEGIPSQRLYALALPELAYEAVGKMARLPGLGRLHKRMSAATWRLYGLCAARKLRRAKGARVFHYRAGFGGASVAVARRLGMVTLCDHALVHPSVLEPLIEHRGILDAAVGNGALGRALDAESRVVLADIDRADAVVVNSDFVKETFLRLGWPAERIHVAYLGVDDNFWETEPPVPPREPPTGPLPLLFASRFERRKGAEVLIEALEEIGDSVAWDLVVAGPVSPDIRAEHVRFFDDDRVTVLGPLSRSEFKRRLIERAIFVFPTFAEGSARAVFDALACGCYCITTPNAGSVVEDGVHGTLVPAGDVSALASAIVALDERRDLLARVGNTNIERIATHHRQAQYGETLAAVYRELAR